MVVPKDALEMGAGAQSSVSHCGPPGPQALNPAPDTFLHYRTSKVRALRAARLERLVRELVSGDPEQDPGFVPAFLATHRAFVPTGRVLGLLLPPPAPPLPPGSVPTGDSSVPTPDCHLDARSTLCGALLLPSRTFLLSPLQPLPSSPDLGVGVSFHGGNQENRRKRSDFQQELEVCLQ